MPDHPVITLSVDPRHAQTAVRLACKAMRGEILHGASVALRRTDDRLVVKVWENRVVMVEQVSL
jgi:hypothetical protein